MNRNRLISELIYYNPYDFNDYSRFSDFVCQITKNS